MLCLLMLCVMPTSAMAATNYKGKTQRFLIRESGSYDSTGVWVRMESTSADGKTGWIIFEGKVKVAGKNIPKGSTYKYTISSLKEDGKITLKYDMYESVSNGATATPSSAVHKITAKIHVDSSKGCKIANIWKIDTLKTGALGITKGKVYFRNN